MSPASTTCQQGSDATSHLSWTDPTSTSWKATSATSTPAAKPCKVATPYCMRRHWAAFRAASTTPSTPTATTSTVSSICSSPPAMPASSALSMPPAPQPMATARSCPKSSTTSADPCRPTPSPNTSTNFTPMSSPISTASRPLVFATSTCLAADRTPTGPTPPSYPSGSRLSYATKAPLSMATALTRATSPISTT